MQQDEGLWAVKLEDQPTNGSIKQQQLVILTQSSADGAAGALVTLRLLNTPARELERVTLMNLGRKWTDSITLWID